MLCQGEQYGCISDDDASLLTAAATSLCIGSIGISKLFWFISAVRQYLADQFVTWWISEVVIDRKFLYSVVDVVVCISS